MKLFLNNHPEIFAKLQNRQMDKPLQNLLNFIICSFKTCSQLSKIDQIVINHKQFEIFLFLFKIILLIENRNFEYCRWQLGQDWINADLVLKWIILHMFTNYLQLSQNQNFMFWVSVTFILIRDQCYKFPSMPISLQIILFRISKGSAVYDTNLIGI